MSLDEALHFHERFNDRFGIPWQLPYAPVLLGAFAAAVYLVGYLHSRGVALRWIIAGVCWGVAQAFDLIETQFFATTDTPFEVLVVLEEGLEMLGSSLFAWTLLDAGTRERARIPASVPAPTTSPSGPAGSALGDRDAQFVAHFEGDGGGERLAGDVGLMGADGRDGARVGFDAQRDSV